MAMPSISEKMINLWKGWEIRALILVSLILQVILIVFGSYRRRTKRSWGNSNISLTFIAIPVFIAGIIKYGERTWVLWSSSTKRLRSSLISTPDAGPDYAQSVQTRAGKRKMDKDSLALMVLPRKEVELSFLYDLLYTKARLVYSWLGICIRLITFLSSLSALVTFLIFVSDKQVYAPADVAITYTLLGGAIALEIYALLMLLIFSDWTRLWLVKFMHIKGPSERALDVKRWSGIISKHNLVNICLKEANSPWIKIQKLLCVHEFLAKYLYITWQDVDTKLKELIFQQLKKKSETIQGDDFKVNLCRTLLSHRGDNALKEMKCDEQFEWSTVGVEFDHSLLLWHIATEICYYEDTKRFKDDTESLNKCSKISKCLSDYMLYLLVVCPTMLPKGIGEIRYRDTCADATRLAKQLQLLRPADQDSWGFKEKWEMINKVWVEMLAYAAVHCEWKEHAQQLRRGGELLTHVCLVMAHLGLSEQYQIQKQFIHHPNRRFFEELLLKVYKKPRSEFFLCLLQCFLRIPDCCGTRGSDFD
ncbi:hypothetical protein CCACVL1_13706 [Corchorus capsularis]|uniref:DUF4220 domain-containing protein n=1 Tax=Corchorus capsularis TaxID=210143 RepID=A0A1R3I9X9_COCAP|nr:hypothetical protein CCACVL1_13706 [Corchorus capsularis]